MTWLQRWLGAGGAGEPANEGAKERRLAAVAKALQNAGFRMHDAAQEFLRGRLDAQMDVPIAGVEGIVGFVHFDPEKVLRFLRPSDLPRLAALMGASACPIGTTGGHTMFVFLDDAGRSYLLDMEWDLFAELADAPAAMMEILCDGRNGRVDSFILDDQGRPTGEMIRAGDERRHWGLEDFPHVAPFLPPVSLSPARRPPTWRAMVKAAEAGLEQGGAPSALLVTCGGFIKSRSGAMYFVAHCENSLYVRTHGAFKVVPPPPGVPSTLRTGEVVPFQAPPGW